MAQPSCTKPGPGCSGRADSTGVKHWLLSVARASGAPNVESLFTPATVPIADAWSAVAEGCKLSDDQLAHLVADLVHLLGELAVELLQDGSHLGQGAVLDAGVVGEALQGAGHEARGLHLLDERARVGQTRVTALGQAHRLLDHHEAILEHPRAGQLCLIHQQQLAHARDDVGLAGVMGWLDLPPV